MKKTKKYAYGTSQVTYNPNKMMRQAPYYNLNAVPDYTAAYNTQSQFSKGLGTRDSIMGGLASATSIIGSNNNSNPYSFKSKRPRSTTPTSGYGEIPMTAKKGISKLKYKKAIGAEALVGLGTTAANIGGTALESKKLNNGLDEPQEQDEGAAIGGGILKGAAAGATAGLTFGPWGCVCAGTKVITNSGEFKNIEDLKQEDGIIGFNDTSYTQQPINAFQAPAKKECLEIETRLGHTLRCSTDHPIYSSGQGRAFRIYVDEIRTRVRQYNYIDAENLKLGDNIGLINEVPVWGTKEMKNPYLVGICIGDGTYGKNRGVRIFSADSDTWDYIETNNLGYQIDKNGYLKYNKEFRAYRLKEGIPLFRDLGIYEQTKLNKRLPEDIYLYDKESVCKLIAGLIDTDGYVSFNPNKPKNAKIGFCQSNIELIKQVREQLVKLGIHSSLKTNKAKKTIINEKESNSKEAYVLVIKDKHSVINFYNNIPLNISYKKENLNNFYNYVKDLSTKDHKEVTNIYSDKIIRITPIGLQDIYNLEAGGSNTYVANLIITHNSLIGGAVGGIAGGVSSGVMASDSNKTLRRNKLMAKNKASIEKSNAQQAGIDTTFDMANKGKKKIKYQTGSRQVKSKQEISPLDIRFADSILTANSDKQFVKDYLAKKGNITAYGRSIFPSTGNFNTDILNAYKTGNYIDLKSKQNISRFNSARLPVYKKGTKELYPNQENTKLSKGQEIAYLNYLKKNNITESSDYDMRGYWKEQGFKGLENRTTGQHFTDSHKKLAPFDEGDGYQQLSDESKFASKFDKRGQGVWINNKFTPYKKGVRKIETEGREPVFTDKDKNGKRALVYYNPSDPNHSQGGVSASVIPNTQISLGQLVSHNATNSNKILPEGAAIVTAKKGLNKLAMKAYNNGNYKKLNSIIDKMPEDKVDKNQSGNKYVKDRNKKYYKKYVVDTQTKKTENRKTGETANKLLDQYQSTKNKLNSTKDSSTKKQLEGSLKRQSDLMKKKGIINPEVVVSPKTNKSSDKPALGKALDKSPVKQGTITGYTKPSKGKTVSKSSPNLKDLASRVPYKKYTDQSDKIDEPKSQVAKEESPTNVGASKTETTPSVSTKPKNSLGLDKDGLTSMLTSVRASDINNISRGLKRPETNPLFLPDLTLEKYRDMSDPTRRASQEQERTRASTARNVSGGNAQNYQANRAMASTENFKNQADINANEINRATDVNTRNVERKNAFSTTKAALQKEQFTENQQNRARNEDLLQQGLVGVDEAIYRGIQDYRTGKADEARNTIYQQSLDLAQTRADAEAQARLEAAKQGKTISDNEAKDNEYMYNKYPDQYEKLPSGKIIKKQAKGVKKLKYKMKRG